MSDASQNYFVMIAAVSDRTASVSDPDDLPRRAQVWITGALLPVEVPSPIEYLIEDDDEGEMGAFIETSAPLMSRDLLETLTLAGVDNLEVHEAVITEAATGREYHDYVAVNIVGLLAAGDRARTVTESIDGLGTWIHRFAMDESAARGALMFRLREGPSKVMVHRSVKEAIEARALPLIQFIPADEVSG